MKIPDLINGGFETLGGVVCWLDVRRLLRDRKIAGIDWRVRWFFCAWGWWNCFYYPSLGQWASFTGGVLLTIANTVWILLALNLFEIDKPRQLDRWSRPIDCRCDICEEMRNK